MARDAQAKVRDRRACVHAFADEVSAEELKEAVHKEGEQHAPKLRLHKVQRPSSWRLGAALGRAEGRA